MSKAGRAQVSLQQVPNTPPSLTFNAVVSFPLVAVGQQAVNIRKMAASTMGRCQMARAGVSASSKSVYVCLRAADGCKAVPQSQLNLRLCYLIVFSKQQDEVYASWLLAVRKKRILRHC